MSNDNLEWFKSFTKILDKHNIWYSIDCGTMLGAIRHSGPIPWDDDFDVVMRVEDYEKLKKIYPQHCLDGTTAKNYPLIFPKFVPSLKNFLNSSVFVDIFLLIPTTKQKLKKFYKFKSRVNFVTQCMHSTWDPYEWYQWIAYVLTWPFQKTFSKMTYLSISKQLQTDQHEGFFFLNNPFEKLSKNWIKQFSFKTEKIKFSNIDVEIMVEHKQVLTNRYGSDYMTPKPEIKAFKHKNAVSITKKRS